MPKVTIDGIEYNTEDLTANGKAQVASLQFVDAQIVKIRGEINVYKTAKSVYTAALKKEFEKLNLS